MKLFFDTETCGLPIWNEPSGGENQPHIVQIAALLVDSDRNIVETLDVIIKPDGWIIPDDVIAIHGITNERAHDEGIAEADALAQFLDMHSRCASRIGHNQSFDARIMRIALKRYCTDEIADAFREHPTECTGLLTKPIMQMLPKNRYGFKMPKLSEAYLHFTGKELEGAHSAMADAQACMEVYFAAIDHLAAAAA